MTTPDHAAIKAFEEKFRETYGEALLFRDWQTCDYLAENKEIIRCGWRWAMEHMKNLTPYEDKSDLSLFGDKQEG